MVTLLWGHGDQGICHPEASPFVHILPTLNLALPTLNPDPHCPQHLPVARSFLCRGHPHIWGQCLWTLTADLS